MFIEYNKNIHQAMETKIRLAHNNRKCDNILPKGEEIVLSFQEIYHLHPSSVANSGQFKSGHPYIKMIKTK